MARRRRTNRRHKPLDISAVALTGSPPATASEDVAIALFTLIPIGGLGPFTFSISPPGSGGDTIAGVSVNASTGDVTGTPTTSGTYHALLAVTDSSPVPQTAFLVWDFTVIPVAGPSGWLDDETVRRGALTRANDGAIRLVANDGRTITATAIQGGGTSTGWSVTQPNILKRSSVGIVDASTLVVQCTDGSANTDAATFTFQSVANYYSCAPDPSGAETELKAILNAIGSAGGKHVLMEPGVNKIDYNTAAWNNRNFAADVKIESRKSVRRDKTIFLGPGLMAGFINLTLKNIHMKCPETVDQPNIPGVRGFQWSGTIKYNKWLGCTFSGFDWQPDQPTSELPPYNHMSWDGLMSPASGARVYVDNNGSPQIGLHFDENCEFYGARRMLMLPPTDFASQAYIVVENFEMHHVGSDYILLGGSQQIVRKFKMYNPYKDPSVAGHDDFCQLTNTASNKKQIHIYQGLLYGYRDDAIPTKTGQQGPFIQTDSGADAGWTVKDANVFNLAYVGESSHGNMIRNVVDVKRQQLTLACRLDRNTGARPTVTHELTDGIAFSNYTFANLTGFTLGAGFTRLGTGDIQCTPGVISDLKRSISIGTLAAAIISVGQGPVTHRFTVGVTGRTVGTLTPKFTGGSGTLSLTPISTNGAAITVDADIAAAYTGAVLTKSADFDGHITQFKVERLAPIPVGTGAPVNEIIKDIVCANIDETDRVSNGVTWNNNTQWQAGVGGTNRYPELFQGTTFNPTSHTDALAQFAPKAGGPLTVAGGADRLQGAINPDGTLRTDIPAGITIPV